VARSSRASVDVEPVPLASNERSGRTKAAWTDDIQHAVAPDSARNVNLSQVAAARDVSPSEASRMHSAIKRRLALPLARNLDDTLRASASSPQRPT
jgi:hypothetical protein